MPVLIIDFRKVDRQHLYPVNEDCIMSGLVSKENANFNCQDVLSIFFCLLILKVVHTYNG